MANPVLEKQFGHVPADAALQSVDAPRPTGEPGKMTMGSVMFSTLVLLLLVAAGATFGWANAAAVQRWYWLLAVTMIVLLIATVTRPRLVVVTGVFYSVVQGALLGSLSKIYETWYDGIVYQALLATLAAFLAMLFLYATRIIKVTQRLRSVIIIATVGVALFYLFGWVLALFGMDVPAVTGTGNSAIVFSLVIIVVAALNLLLDFQVIELGVRNGVPRAFSWFAAFGLMVTIIWLYVSILRLLALTRR